MSDVGLRSGKITAGLYKCGSYHIKKMPTDYWWIYKYYGSDHEYFVKQFRTLTDAYYHARYELKD